MDTKETKTNELENPVIKQMFEAGLHFGFSKSRRHPSMKEFIFGLKNRVEILDLTKTVDGLEEAKKFAESIGKSGRQILLVSSKGEAERSIREIAEGAGLPYVSGRWLGGTLTNFSELGKRIKKLVDLTDKREKGELSKYTKKERLMIDRDIEKLQDMFGGLLNAKGLPGALFVVDPKKEKTTVAEAKRLKIPVIALMNSDNNLKDAEYPIVGNDSVSSSIEFVTKEIIEAFKAGQKSVAKGE